jgi:hypothetical protein
MSSELMMANVVMLALAVMAGAAYVYFFRGMSPYAPRVKDYLERDRTDFI